MVEIARDARLIKRPQLTSAAERWAEVRAATTEIAALNMAKLKTVFLGSDQIALPLLNALAANPLVEFAAVVTQPDRPVGRGQHVTANEIKRWAVARGLPVFQPEKLTEDFRLTFETLGADLSLVMAYGHILKEAFIATPRLGTLNLHASILPEFRGASPIQTAIATGRQETGVSLMRIVRQLDAGPVADIERVRIERTDTAFDIERKLSLACIPLVTRNLAALAEGNLLFSGQDDGRATYCRRLMKTDGVLDFAQGAPVLAARINGLYPWPGCMIQVGDLTVKLGLADWSEGSCGSREPGTVLGAAGNAVTVATGHGQLRLLRLQRPGGKMLPAADFIRGMPISEGTILPSMQMPALVSPAPFKW